MCVCLVIFLRNWYLWFLSTPLCSPPMDSIIKKKNPKVCGFLDVTLLFNYLVIPFFICVHFPPFDSLFHKISFYCMPRYYRLNLTNTVFVLVCYAWHCVDTDHNVELCYQFLFSCMTFFFCYEGKSSKLVLTLNKKYTTTTSNHSILVLITHKLLLGMSIWCFCYSFC